MSRLASAPVGFVPDPRPRRFDLDVAEGGYAWWYIDVLADDGEHALTAIIFVGSVFSPHYFAARRRAHARAEPPPDPQRFCAVNLALYQPSGGDRRRRGRNRRAWVLSEHQDFARDAGQLRVGSSAIAWREDAGGPLLCVDIDEREPFLGRRPLFRRSVRGRIRLRPDAIFGPCVELDRWREQPRHRWYPVAPHGRAEVEFDAPELHFSGSAYHDVNEGDEPLERAFAAWNWSRTELGEGRTAILYDVVDAQGHAHARGWSVDAQRREIADLGVEALGPAQALPRAGWGMSRAIRCRVGHTPALVDTLEDSPFYTRNLVRTVIADEPSLAVHESIDFRRFTAASTQFLLPFKVRRD